MAARKGYRWCTKGEHWRAERFFRPKGRVCSTCQRKGTRKASHETRVMKTYGLLPGEYDKLLAAQGGGCAICGGTRSGNLDVDHDHASGLVRGLVCKLHNRRLLPAARDKPELLRAAADYLENPPALKHLGERHYVG